MLRGSCNCGAVTFTVEDGDYSATACHCGQCRKQSGHYWVSAPADASRFHIAGDVRWYRASPQARRGFCGICGCFLFWSADGEDRMSFSLGSIDGPTGLNLQEHIFTRFKGDYYDIADGVPQRED